jgi:DNA-binding CsgD family transcriptional regulator
MGLVERGDAMTVLDGLLAAAVSGKGRVAVVTGAVGTGKTELVNTFAERVVDLNGLAITAVGTRAERDLPLGVLTQLLMDAPLVPDERRRALDLLHEGTMSVTAGEDGAARIDPQVVHGLCTILLDLSQRYPLVIVVDDVDEADPASVVCLLYLARRVRFAPMLVVFSHAGFGRVGEVPFEVEGLGRAPHGAVVSLGVLSPAGVGELAGVQLGVEDARRVAVRWHEWSGGNPVLVQGLLAEVAEGGVVDGEPVAGGRFAEAVVGCVRRLDPWWARVLQAVAVFADASCWGELLGVDAVRVGQAVRGLTAAGLLVEGDVRHPVVRSAVLSVMDAGQCRSWHERAAVLAFHAGASSRVVADLLVGAGRVQDAWAVAVLEDAARVVLREGGVDAGVRYLELAWRSCGDEQQRARIMTTMLRASWRINPSMSSSYLPELTVALRHGVLRAGDAVALAKALLWNGQFDEARGVLEYVGGAGGELDAEGVTELAVVRPWLRATYPSLAGVVGSGPGVVMSTVASSHRLEAASALVAVLTRGPSVQVQVAVERILHNSRLDEMSLDTVESALLALTYGGWPERAVPWCEVFMREAAARRAPSRLARLSAVRAEMALRLGDLPGALEYARSALQVMPANSWGVAVGGPLSVQILAATGMGRFEVVRELLDQPVPAAMMQTRYGLQYLLARGRYSMAIGQLPLALRDFERAGELAGAWQLDVPGLVAWRVEAAEALLRMGRVDTARKLIEEQLQRCGKNNPRVLGMGMRLLAAVSQLRHRPMFLRQAMDVHGGDDYELARALVDLTDAYQALAEPRRAGVIARRARALVEKCEATPLLKTLAPDLTRDDTEAPSTALNPVGAAILSDAEQRVATLAADGYTNREISKKLFITISTVEQHLTRIYRKLNVTRRTDLPVHLPMDYSVSS